MHIPIHLKSYFNCLLGEALTEQKIPKSSLWLSQDWRKPYENFLKSFQASKGSRIIPYGHHKGLPLIKLETPGSDRLIIISGVHGEEQVGPITIQKYVKEITADAISKSVGLTIYPMMSPTGWGRGRRKTVDGKTTNLLVEFLVDGRWTEDVPKEKGFTRYRTAKDICPEALAMWEDIKSLPRIPSGMIDIHQDSDLDKKKLIGHYSYVFEAAPFLKISHQAGRHCRLAVGSEVELYDSANGKAKVSRDGFIFCNFDCTTQGALAALGCPYTVTIETSLGTPVEQVHKVNLEWIHGMIDLVAR